MSFTQLGRLCAMNPASVGQAIEAASGEGKGAPAILAVILFPHF
jgi:hypothetical protein